MTTFPCSSLGKKEKKEKKTFAYTALLFLSIPMYGEGVLDNKGARSAGKHTYLQPFLWMQLGQWQQQSTAPIFWSSVGLGDFGHQVLPCTKPPACCLSQGAIPPCLPPCFPAGEIRDNSVQAVQAFHKV